MPLRPAIRRAPKSCNRRSTAFCASATTSACGPPSHRSEINRPLLARPDPGQTVPCMRGREDPDLAAEQEPQRLHGVPDPADIGDDRDPLPLRHAVDAEPQVIPPGARNTG